MDIRHKKTSGKGPASDPTNIGGEDWDDVHVDGDGNDIVIPIYDFETGTYRIPKLIETKTLGAGSTTTTFSGLDGDVDGEYLIISDLTIVASGVDTQVVMLPNNDTNNNYTGIQLYNYPGDTHGAGDAHTGAIALTTYAETCKVLSKTTLRAATGSYRSYSSDLTINNSNNRLQRNLLTQQWKNSDDNITSLVCKVSTQSMSGTISLYKMVDFEVDNNPVVIPNPGKTIEGYELIEEKTVDSVTSTTFENLDGDAEDEYLIESDIVGTYSGGTSYISLNPNADTANGSTDALYMQDGDSHGSTGLLAFNVFGYISFNESNRIVNQIRLYPKTGAKRMINVNINWKSAGHVGRWVGTSTWNNTVDNITSLEIKGTNSVFSGKIRLYRKISVTAKEHETLLVPPDVASITPAPATLRVPQLIEEKTFTDQSDDYTFANLNGDVDKEYLIVFDLDVPSGGSDQNIRLSPNNTNSDQFYGIEYRSQGNVGINSTGFTITPADWGRGRMSGECKLLAQTGKPRVWSGMKSLFISAGTMVQGNIIQEWRETTINITSLVLINNTGTFSGTIRLYKMVDMVITTPMA